MEHQVAGTVSEERANPLDQRRADPLAVEEIEEEWRFHIVKPSLHIEEESSDPVAEGVEGFNIVW